MINFLASLIIMIKQLNTLFFRNDSSKEEAQKQVICYYMQVRNFNAFSLLFVLFDNYLTIFYKQSLSVTDMARFIRSRLTEHIDLGYQWRN